MEIESPSIHSCKLTSKARRTRSKKLSSYRAIWWRPSWSPTIIPRPKTAASSSSSTHQVKMWMALWSCAISLISHSGSHSRQMTATQIQAGPILNLRILQSTALDRTLRSPPCLLDRKSSSRARRSTLCRLRRSYSLRKRTDKTSRWSLWITLLRPLKMKIHPATLRLVPGWNSSNFRVIRITLPSSLVCPNCRWPGSVNSLRSS